MTHRVRDVMSVDLVVCPVDATLQDVAALMRDHDVGDVLILRDDVLVGIVTDRDLAIRAVAGGADPATVTVGSVCSPGLVCIAGEMSIDDAAEVMRSGVVRRLPVVEHDLVVGIVSICDVERDRAPRSVLGGIATVSPDH